MKRIVLPIWSVLVIGASLIGVCFLQLPMQEVVIAASETKLVLDVAVDGRTFNYNRGVPLDQIVRGDGFIISSKIFPGGTLLSGDQSNDPNSPGSIGTLVARGTTTGSLADHLANPQAPGIFWTQNLLLDDVGMIVAEGWVSPSGTNQAAVVGGVGAFSGASGEVSFVNIGTNNTGGPNTRLTINLAKARK